MSDVNEPLEPEFDELPPSNQKRRSRAWTVVAIVGGVFGVLIVLCCGVSIWFVAEIAGELPAARSAADRFFQELQAGRLDAAYAETSSEFQANIPRESFEKLLAMFPLLKDHEARSINLGRMYAGTNGASANFQVRLEAGDETTICRMTLIKVGGVWKVHHLHCSLRLPGQVDEVP